MELLKALASASAPSGRENQVCRIIEERMKNACDEIKIDPLGNLICHKKGNGKKLMLTAHMDEIGFVVTYICDDGFLRFGRVGSGMKPYNCINSACVFTNGTRGTISYENKEKPGEAGFDKMYIDIGAKNKEEAEKMVSVGDMLTFAPSFAVSEKRVISKALGDRVGIYCLIKAMENVKETENDVYAVFTTQSEVGRRGAGTAAYGINPHMAIAVDVSETGDTPFSKEDNLTLSAGPAIKIKDSSFIIHSSVRELLLQSARKCGIPYQIDSKAQGGTDAGAIHLTACGIPSGAISIPARYVFSPNEVCDTDDIVNTVKMIEEVIKTDISLYA